MTVGGLLGCGLGGLAGLCSLLILKASGTSMEEVRYWQYNWKRERDEIVRAAELVSRNYKSLFIQILKTKCLQSNSPTEKDPLLESRGDKAKENTLNNIQIESKSK